MKLSNAILLASAAGLAASMSGSVHAYSSDLSNTGLAEEDYLNGSAQWEHHHVQFKSANLGGPGCPAGAGTPCQDNFGFLVEAAGVVALQNKFYTDSVAANGANAFTDFSGNTVIPIGADSYESVGADCQLTEFGTFPQVSGSLDSAGTITPSVRTHTNIVNGNPEAILLNGITHRPVLLNTSGAGTYSINWMSGPNCYRFVTNADGKITSGTYATLFVVPDGTGGLFNVGNYTFFDTRSTMTTVCATTNGPTLAQAEAWNTGYQAAGGYGAADGDASFGIGSIIGGTSCQVATVFQLVYNHCDSDRGQCIGQASAKAVPVPAYAAAVLGLGLVGVTLLTGRRKSVS